MVQKFIRLESFHVALHLIDLDKHYERLVCSYGTPIHAQYLSILNPFCMPSDHHYAYVCFGSSYVLSPSHTQVGDLQYYLY